MTKATDIAIILLMTTSVMVLILEVIGNRQARSGLFEKPHIRLLTMGALFISLLMITIEIFSKQQLPKYPLLFINDISSIFLTINTIIALLLVNKSLAKPQGENYFLVLASLALSMACVTSPSLIIKMIASTGWLVLVTTLAIQSTSGGKKAEIGLKLSFTAAIVLLLFFFSIFLLYYAGLSTNMALLSIDGDLPNVITLLSLVILALAALSLAGIPPFHFGHVDCADGGSLSSAFLLLSNSFILGCSLLLNIKNIFSASGINIKDETNLLVFMLIFGFMVLWLRALDQSKIRRTIAYIATSVGPLFAMSILFGSSALLPKLIFILAVYSFLTMTLFTLFGSFTHMDAINMPWQTWEDMSGFGRSNPWLTLVFLVSISSIAGLPGTLGYFIKLSLIAPLQDSMFFSGSILLSIAIGAACSMRIFVFMFSKTSQVPKSPTGYRPKIALLLASMVLIALGFFPFVR